MTNPRRSRVAAITEGISYNSGVTRCMGAGLQTAPGDTLSEGDTNNDKRNE